MIARPFSHVAVLNRGEAAVRFLRAARHWRRQHRQPLRILALYTHPDAEAPFVRMASAALCLGEPLVPAETGQLRSAYLDVERVVTLAKAAGADALWPGWGFAAERPELPEACEAHGLVFLGPSASAMRLLGDKVAAKQLADRLGVPVSPWSGGPVDEAQAAAVAARIGLPGAPEGRRWWRGTRHPSRERCRRARRRHSCRRERGGGRFRRRIGVRRSVRAGGKAHRGADPGRHPR